MQTGNNSLSFYSNFNKETSLLLSMEINFLHLTVKDRSFKKEWMFISGVILND